MIHLRYGKDPERDKKIAQALLSFMYDEGSTCERKDFVVRLNMDNTLRRLYPKQLFTVQTGPFLQSYLGRVVQNLMDMGLVKESTKSAPITVQKWKYAYSITQKGRELVEKSFEGFTLPESEKCSTRRG